MATKPTTAEDIEAVMTIVDRTDVRSTMTGLVRLENILVAAEPKHRATVRMAVIDLLVAQREYAHLIDCANNVLTDPHASPSQVAYSGCASSRYEGMYHPILPTGPSGPPSTTTP